MYFRLAQEEKNDSIVTLFREADNYEGSIVSDAFFIKRHYQELNIDELLKTIKIRDTTSIIPSEKQKYISWKIEKSEDNLPIIITFIFDKMYGFDKIASPSVLDNHMYWNKSSDSLHKKGVFPTVRN